MPSSRLRPRLPPTSSCSRWSRNGSPSARSASRAPPFESRPRRRWSRRLAEVELDRYRVEVTRVPVGRVVETAPLARVEGDTTIVPVLEERFVVVKQLFLAEELHIRHVVEREVVREPVALRRQHATVERVGDRAEVVGPDDV